MPVSLPSSNKSVTPEDITSSTSNTSRNPVRLSVATRDGPYTKPIPDSSIPASSSSLCSDDEVLKRAAIKKAQLQRRVERWMDKFMEHTVDTTTFKKAVDHLTPSQYQDIAHERHLNSLCSYPICPNPPQRPYSSSRRFVISTRNRTIKPQEGNRDEGYCSKKCQVQGTWVESRLSTVAVWLRGVVQEVELLEDVAAESGSKIDEPVGRAAGTATPVKSATTRRKEALLPASSTFQKSIVANPKQPLYEAPSAQAGTNEVAALIDALTVYERPIVHPHALGEPPLLSHSSTIQSQPLPLPQATPSPSYNPVRDARRNPSSILSTPSNLSRTLLAATHSIPPSISSQQIGGPEEEMESEESEESEWEKEMSFGPETEEEKGWFDEALLARKILQEGE
ncbi:hypothetical protein L204_104271 [Cryptococcus depauperatus]|nr:hypothetical protein L204_04905 [Cryptococcus depauperatus CBS 7855]